MKELGELFKQYGSDKDRNGYTPVYQSLFQSKRFDHIKMLEVGIGTMVPGEASSMVGYALEGYEPGGSLRAWRDFFQNGQIHGADVQADCMFGEERISTFLCDSTSKNDVDNLFVDNDIIFDDPNVLENYDIIIDDGLHTPLAQWQTFKNFYQLLKPGGLYIIEDIVPGSQIWGDYYSKIKELAHDSLSYGATVQNPDGSWKVPIMIITKNISNKV